MIRTIFVPESEKFVFSVPKEYVGKQIEVIAFIVQDTRVNRRTRKDISFTDFGLQMPENYKFDREEANAR